MLAYKAMDFSRLLGRSPATAKLNLHCVDMIS